MIRDFQNVALLKRLGSRDFATSKGPFAEAAVWHHAHRNLTQMQGDHGGWVGVRRLVGAIAEKSSGTFQGKPMSVATVGSDLSAVRPRNALAFERCAAAGTPAATGHSWT